MSLWFDVSPVRVLYAMEDEGWRVSTIFFSYLILITSIPFLAVLMGWEPPFAGLEWSGCEKFIR